MKAHDEKYYLDELTRLFDPKRIYQKFGGFGEDAFVEEVQTYYHDLSFVEKEVFAQAVLHWMWSGEDLRQMQAIRLCGDVKLKESVDDLLRMGEILRKKSPSHKDLGHVVSSLGRIGDAKALDFLRQEVKTGEYSNGALAAISMIDLDESLDLLTSLVEEYYQTAKTPVLTEWLFSSLLRKHDQIARQLGYTLRDFSNKAYLIERFREGVRLQGFDAKGRYLTKQMQKKIVQQFCEGLAQGSELSTDETL